MVEVVVADTKFFAFSRASKEALKSANLLKSLHVNTLILGEIGVGKKTLATYIKDIPIIHAKDEKIYKFIHSNECVIIQDFNLLPQFDKFNKTIQKTQTQIIATASKINEKSKQMFSVSISLPPLRDRMEDVEGLSKIFLNEACEVFGIKENLKLDLNELHSHLHVNAQSLKRYVYLYALSHSLNKKEFMNFSQIYFLKNMKEEDIYKQNLTLFDVPIIKAGFEKFNSQLAMSKSFGINRNTLRKKINENKQYF